MIEFLARETSRPKSDFIPPKLLNAVFVSQPDEFHHRSRVASHKVLFKYSELVFIHLQLRSKFCLNLSSFDCYERKKKVSF